MPKPFHLDVPISSQSPSSSLEATISAKIASVQVESNKDVKEREVGGGQGSEFLLTSHLKVSLGKSHASLLWLLTFYHDLLHLLPNVYTYT